MSVYALFDYLDQNCSGLHMINLIHLYTSMMGWYYAKAEGIP